MGGAMISPSDTDDVTNDDSDTSAGDAHHRRMGQTPHNLHHRRRGSDSVGPDGNGGVDHGNGSGVESPLDFSARRRREHPERHHGLEAEVDDAPGGVEGQEQDQQAAVRGLFGVGF